MNTIRFYQQNVVVKPAATLKLCQTLTLKINFTIDPTYLCVFFNTQNAVNMQKALFYVSERSLRRYDVYQRFNA